ncbi:hypothetical protein TL16_g00655 [Triparma laevis f. inornata]|uniref:Calmodulin n=1 Tax=Triparma laevis f. inornata TaxID=1714386 RepID=A0A9W7DPU6_9STRA|nr:hypothetical protein TL16_g00655 [Triparma laevis f. inornata]
MADDQVLSGYLYKKGSGLLRRGLIGRTNWKKRYFVLSWSDQTRLQASLAYYDSPKAMVRDPSSNPLNVIAVTDSTTVSAVSNPNHADKFCFQIVIADEGGGDGLAKLEEKFSREELEQYEALFASVDDDGSGSIDVKEVGALLEKLGSKVSSEEELQQIVDEVDEDGSGEIEYSEFLSIMFNLKSGKKSALGDKFGGALKFGFPKGVKSPFKSKQPSNVRQLWSDSEAERGQWILAIEGTVSTIKANKRPAAAAPSTVDVPLPKIGQGMEEEGGRHRVESGITTAPSSSSSGSKNKTNTNLSSVLEAEETTNSSDNRASPNPVKANPDLVVQPPSPPITNTQVTQAPWADDAGDQFSGREARLLREKETLEQQLILIVSMNEELNGTLEAAVKEHDEREEVMTLHLETLAGEVDTLKGGRAGSSQVLDERNSRLEAQIESLQNMVSTASAEAETVRNRLLRAEGRLLEQGDELKEEQDKSRKLRDKVGVLEGVRDVLESELEASTSKASAVYSSPVKRRAEKSPFQLEQESEREREKLQKANEELSRRAKMAEDKSAALERRLLSEAEDEEVLKVRVELAGRNQEIGELKDRVRILEGEIEAVTLSNSMNVSFDEPPPPPPDEEGGGGGGERMDIEELSRTRLEAEKWQNAALAAANVAIVAARSEDDALNNSIDVDTLMGRIEELEKEGWGDRLKRIEGENKELKGKVERVEGELGVAVDEKEEVR